MIYILKLGHVSGVQLDSTKSTESLSLSIYIFCFCGKEQGSPVNGVCSKYTFPKVRKMQLHHEANQGGQMQGQYLCPERRHPRCSCSCIVSLVCFPGKGNSFPFVISYCQLQKKNSTTSTNTYYTVTYTIIHLYSL